jgi:hypothetical protein
MSESGQPLLGLLQVLIDYITRLELTESQPLDTLDGTGFNVFNGKAEKQCYTLGGIGKRVLRIPVPKVNKTGLDESRR